MHQEHVVIVFLEFVLLIGLGIFGRAGAKALNQSPVLGELVIGVITATIVHLAGGSFGSLVRDMHLFGEIGVVILLFFVGLELNLKDLIKAGPRAGKVAGLGVAVPLVLGVLCSYILLPIAGFNTALFIGATLCATSVGISARVFKDLKRLGSGEAQLVLGAAVIDDVLGLIILTVVSGLAGQGEFDAVALARTIIIASLFIGFIVWFGEGLGRIAIENLEFLEPEGRRLLIPVATCFFLSWIAGEAGLAPILGAFAAGLMMRDSHYKEKGEPIQEQVQPLESLFAPMFFVLMGLQVDLSTLFHGRVFLLAVILCIAAVVGKLACALVAGKKVDGLIVGIGMIPRGEVGLIFAGVGRSLEVFDDDLFAALVIMIIVTTLITPPLLRWSIYRQAELDLPPPPGAKS